MRQCAISSSRCFYNKRLSLKLVFVLTLRWPTLYNNLIFMVKYPIILWDFVSPLDNWGIEWNLHINDDHFSYLYAFASVSVAGDDSIRRAATNSTAVLNIVAVEAVHVNAAAVHEDTTGCHTLKMFPRLSHWLFIISNNNVLSTYVFWSEYSIL